MEAYVIKGGTTLILQTKAGLTTIDIPEHRTDRVCCGNVGYVGVLTSTRQRKILRTLDDEVVPEEKVPLIVRTTLQMKLDHLEEVFFPGANVPKLVVAASRPAHDERSTKRGVPQTTADFREPSWAT